MRAFLGITLLAGVFSGTLRADFSYTSKTQLTGGALYDAVLAMGSLGRGAKKPIFATHLIKGNRMATLTKNHATVVLLDSETIYEIDFVKKTYLVVTFAQMKQTLDQAQNQASARPAFQVSSKPTGRTKAIGFLKAKELIVTMNIEGPSPQAVTHILVDSWILTEPGFSEAEDLRNKLAAKLSHAYAAGLFEIGMVKPELLPGFEELAKVSNQGDEMPVESAIKMGSPGSGDLAPSEDAKSGIVSGTLSRLGSMGRKKTKGRNSASSASEPDLLVEMIVELSDFSAGTADESKFNVPAGFKEVKSPAPKDGVARVQQ